MSIKPAHIQWLVYTGQNTTTSDNYQVEVWEFRHQPDDRILSAWAKHFREHYCLDTELDYYCKGYNYSHSDYLNKIKFPDAKIAPGPGVRAGDFGEILVADYLEFILEYWVPRVRYGSKVIGNESSKGCDTIGFRFFHRNKKESPDDVMAIFEVKARLTDDKLTASDKPSGFQAAINDSAKDNIRIAESLNYLKQRLHEKKQKRDAARIERFQNRNDHPCKEVYGAAAIYSLDSFIPQTISDAIVANHPNASTLCLIIIKGKEMMKLVSALYEKAANEA